MKITLLSLPSIHGDHDRWSLAISNEHGASPRVILERRISAYEFETVSPEVCAPIFLGIDCEERDGVLRISMDDAAAARAESLLRVYMTERGAPPADSFGAMRAAGEALCAALNNAAAAVGRIAEGLRGARPLPVRDPISVGHATRIAKLFADAEHPGGLPGRIPEWVIKAIQEASK